MSTRLYLPSTGSAAVEPAFDAAWTVTSAAKRCAAVTTKIGSPASNTPCGAAAAPGDNCLAAQFVSAPLSGDQAISGTIKGQAGAREFSSGLDAMSQLVVRVVSNDGATVRGTLLAAQNEALSSEWGTLASHTNRKFPLAALSPAALTPVNALDGDRLVFEMGAKCGGSAAQSTIRFQDDQAGDLPEDETTASGSANPWLELSGDLVFVEEGGGGDLPRSKFNLGLGVGL